MIYFQILSEKTSTESKKIVRTLQIEENVNKLTSPFINEDSVDSCHFFCRGSPTLYGVVADRMTVKDYLSVHLSFLFTI